MYKAFSGKDKKIAEPHCPATIIVIVNSCSPSFPKSLEFGVSARSYIAFVISLFSSNRNYILLLTILSDILHSDLLFFLI